MTAPMWLRGGPDKGKCFPPRSCSGRKSVSAPRLSGLTPQSVSGSMLQSLPKRRWLLDDAWAEVSSFRGNGGRTGRER